MWRLLWKYSIVNNGLYSIYIQLNYVVYVTKNINYHTTMGAYIAPIVFVCNPHSNTEMNPITLVDAAPHSKQNKTRNDSDNCSDKCLTNK